MALRQNYSFLRFFNKQGEDLNFTYDADADKWIGAIYLDQGLSTAEKFILKYNEAWWINNRENWERFMRNESFLSSIQIHRVFYGMCMLYLYYRSGIVLCWIFLNRRTIKKPSSMGR